MGLVLKVRRLHPDAILPAFAHPDDSGMDVCAVEEVLIPPGAWAMVPTGLSFEIPAQTEIQARPRSGLAARLGLSLLNTPATIDEGYRGELKLIVVNFGKEPFRVEKGMRIAQIVLCPVLRPTIVETDTLAPSTRDSAGFGSSGLRPLKIP